MKKIDLSTARVAARSALGKSALLAFSLALVPAFGGMAAAQPAPMNEAGCCCISVKGGEIGCGQKTQAECLAEQPKTPLYDKLPDWAQAVAKSEAAESGKMKTGWHAGKCGS